MNKQVCKAFKRDSVDRQATRVVEIRSSYKLFMEVLKLLPRHRAVSKLLLALQRTLKICLNKC